MPRHDTLRWRHRPIAKDFEAARSFLSLIYPAPHVRRVIRSLHRAQAVRHGARDLLRASSLPLLPSDESHVKTELKRIRRHKALSPVLLIRGDHSRCLRLVVADGYHRICAVCHYDESASVSCVIAPG
jgi:hypothetical protein